MSRFLDARTSSNITTFRTITNEFFEANTPTLAGQVGLNIDPSTSGIIRVQLNGMIGINIPVNIPEFVSVTLTVVRGGSLGSPVIFRSQEQYQIIETGYHTVSFSTADYNVPPPGNGVLAYTLFVTVSENVARVGPENLNASAYTD
ncbi:hypothetical protein MUG87_16445 [Ectobacillus sp. JY-23]|uniref:hypothetical protein n=1 Tax=Ectobacillus sp. JY-23 TaxID=2933872 RepID=UPI001FF4C3D8|nr:hypothetical protein [Ectobacillus sp. JY-23]UOY92011.1 hypothetical protein MUG87_16445 [Ectobacillus sp. JY-23]